MKVLPAVEQEYVVSASGPKNAWATGAESLSNGQKLDVEHWNGRVWQRIAPPPHLGVLDFAAPFAAVGSSSATNAWVFPYQGTVRPNYALHWHEGHWTTMRLSRGAAISATAVFGADNAWAFGVTATGTHLAPYDLRWNGRRWREVDLQGAPGQVDALSPGNMWALGTSTATLNEPASKQITLAMHWNGEAWTAVRVPVAPLPRGGILDDYFTAASPGSFWFAYINFDRNYNFLSNGLLHWHRGHWQRLRLPAHFTFFLNGAAQDGHGGLWVCSPDQIYHYALARWTLQPLPGRDPSCNAMAWIPGTKSAWAVGSLRTASLNLEGAILRYARTRPQPS